MHHRTALQHMVCGGFLEKLPAKTVEETSFAILPTMAPGTLNNTIEGIVAELRGTKKSMSVASVVLCVEHHFLTLVLQCRLTFRNEIIEYAVMQRHDP